MAPWTHGCSPDLLGRVSNYVKSRLRRASPPANYIYRILISRAVVTPVFHRTPSSGAASLVYCSPSPLPCGGSCQSVSEHYSVA
jgi:hypothetical protein